MTEEEKERIKDEIMCLLVELSSCSISDEDFYTGIINLIIAHAE